MLVFPLGLTCLDAMGRRSECAASGLLAALDRSPHRRRFAANASEMSKGRKINTV